MGFGIALSSEGALGAVICSWQGAGCCVGSDLNGAILLVSHRP